MTKSKKTKKEAVKVADNKPANDAANSIDYACPACGYSTKLPPHSHDKCRWCLLKHKHVRMETSRGLAIRRMSVARAEPAK